MSDGLDAEIVFEDRARPDIGGELVFRQADLLALEVVRLLDAVGAQKIEVWRNMRDTKAGTPT